MKRIVDWTLAIILIILLPIFIVGALWQIGGEFLGWAYNNWVTAYILVIVLLQNRQIRKLEQEVKRLWQEQARDDTKVLKRVEKRSEHQSRRDI